ncbi:FixH family protein [Rhodovulum adriaticum]|uniref:Nitrogen fixation protein FixH n=1 Tax=Rhodovulum adriaticum TaxID=35804 RepID=A0A4R2P1F5_RHOAD|nr:FixH family protein [Rhodovulum adriaticum]MBK1636102.1 nitrogen fixation protein FixH [Rhodovulum adriaticum]TCP27485.1 nitrogen fixation protein FixH [Rhodovulum adriaticum]
MSTKQITGRQVLIFTVAAFGVVIAVNLTLAFQAVRTFPGLEVKNSYVASQHFDAQRAAQEALGWTAVADYNEDAQMFVLRVTDAEGLPVQVPGIDLTIGRKTSNRDDKRPELIYYSGAYSAEMALDPGYWTIRLNAVAEDGTEFRQRLELFVRG